MPYIDGFLLAVPKARLDDYTAMAELGRTVWMEHGATAYMEAVADDVPYGAVTSFPRAVMAKEDETVIFSYILYPSKTVRDACNKKVMEDERMKGSMDDAPFDGKRMIFGGFETVVAPQQASEPAGYVDGFVLPIETGELDRFRTLVQDSATLWTELGALSMGEAVADDAPVGELTSFPRSVQLKEGETVGFAFLTYRSRAHRDEVAARMTADKRSEMMQNLPVDRKRMFFGGFRPIVQACALFGVERLDPDRFAFA